MTILHSESFDEAGSPLTTSNTSFDYVGGGPTRSTDTVLGTGSMACAGTAGPHGQIFLAATTDTIYQRFYVKMAALGTVFYLSQVLATTTPATTLSVQSDGGLRMRQGTGTAIGDSSTSLKLSTSEWTRVEWAVTASTVQLRLYKGANMHGSVPDYDSGALTWTPGTFNRTAVGNTVAPDASLLVDEYAVGDAWVGSAVTETDTPPWQRKTAEGWQRMRTRLID